MRDAITRVDDWADASALSEGARPTTSGSTTSRDVARPEISRPATARNRPQSRGDSGNDAGLGRPERLVLTALARYPDGKSRKQLGPLTGYRSDAGHFGNILAGLRTRGLIAGDSSRLNATDEGLVALGEFEPLPEPGPALIEWWLAKLGGAEAKLLRALVEVYPREMSRAELGEATGYRADAGHFGNLISALRGLSLVEGSSSRLRASEELFG